MFEVRKQGGDAYKSRFHRWGLICLAGKACRANKPVGTQRHVHEFWFRKGHWPLEELLSFLSGHREPSDPPATELLLQLFPENRVKLEARINKMARVALLKVGGGA